MMNIADHLDENKRLSWSYFFADEDGMIRPEIVSKFGQGLSAEELKQNRGLAAVVIAKAISEVLPYNIPFRRECDLNEIFDWMRENVHNGWQPRLSCVSFACLKDALNFKLAFS